MYTTAIIIATVIGALILVLTVGAFLPLFSYKKIVNIAKEKGFDKTYYFKSNPGITCTLNSIRLGWFKNHEVNLLVTYPDGSRGALQTTLAEFDKLWTDDPDSVPTFTFN